MCLYRIPRAAAAIARDETANRPETQSPPDIADQSACGTRVREQRLSVHIGGRPGASSA